MPFDGIVAHCTVGELDRALTGGRIEKIYQPEADEIILSVRAKGRNHRLLLSANASNARIQLTETVKENPSSPPMFCMLLRKHLSGGRIAGFEISGYERVISLLVEAMTELGDITVKKLIVEIMGRHSNIIFVNSEGRIIDAVKHIDSEISSVREVMPARPYVLPPSQGKEDPDKLDTKEFLRKLREAGNTPLEKALLERIKGFSPLLCRELAFRSGIDGKAPASALRDAERERLAAALEELLAAIRNGSFAPCIIYEDKALKRPVDFHCLNIRHYTHAKPVNTVNEAMDAFYSGRDRLERLKQMKAGLAKGLATSLERVKKKIALQQEKLREVADRDRLKLYGELLTANIYSIRQGEESVRVLNYYSESEEYIDIPLDPSLTPQANSQVYFRQYAKAKSAFVNTGRQLEEALKELEYLESVSQSLDFSVSPGEIEEIRQELAEQGYLSRGRKAASKNRTQPLPPIKYMSGDGFEMLVGKNNRQNDALTLKTAAAYDLWLHTRNIPGSHVIVRTQKRDVPDATLLEAAMLAAYHSKAGGSSTVPVDYTQVRNVKKPPGAKPGMVTYASFKTVFVTPDEEKVDSLRIK